VIFFYNLDMRATWKPQEVFARYDNIKACVGPERIKDVPIAFVGNFLDKVKNGRPKVNGRCMSKSVEYVEKDGVQLFQYQISLKEGTMHEFEAPLRDLGGALLGESLQELELASGWPLVPQK
jgi:hypothetical protein